MSCCVLNAAFKFSSFIILHALLVLKSALTSHSPVILHYEMTAKGLRVLPHFTVHTSTCKDQQQWCASRLSPGWDIQPEGHQWLKNTNKSCPLASDSEPNQQMVDGLEFKLTAWHFLFAPDYLVFVWQRGISGLCAPEMAPLTLQWSSNSKHKHVFSWLSQR